MKMCRRIRYIINVRVRIDARSALLSPSRHIRAAAACNKTGVFAVAQSEARLDFP
jgi:hypothetical protein